MNSIIIMGRLTRDPEVRYTQGENSMAIARYTLAVDRKGRRAPDGQQADFINVVAFDRAGEFAEKYFRQGMRVLVRGRLQISSYTNRDNVKIPTHEVVVEEQDFADSKDSGNRGGNGSDGSISGGFSNTQSPNAGTNGGTDSRTARSRNAKRGYTGSVDGDGFMNVPDGIDDEGMPF